MPLISAVCVQPSVYALWADIFLTEGCNEKNLKATGLQHYSFPLLQAPHYHVFGVLFTPGKVA